MSEKWNTPERAEKPKHTFNVFPQGDALLNDYIAEHGANAHEREVLRDVMYSYLDEAVGHMELYDSEKGISFPYTRVRLSELAHAIFARYEGARMPAPPQTSVPAETERKTTHEYVVIGFPMNTSVGDPLEFAEFPTHSLFARLPKALEDLKYGREIEDYTVTTLGYPTNEYGALTADATKALQHDPFASMGDAYREFIQGRFPPQTGEHIILNGVSTGSNIAAHLGKNLAASKLVSQDKKSKQAHLSVRLFAPVGIRHFNDRRLREAQMAAGFTVEGINLATSSQVAQTINKEQPAFYKALEERLKGKMAPRMDAEQKRNKQKAILAITVGMLRGTRFPKGVRVTEIMGIEDPLIYSKKRTESVRERMKAQRIASGAFGPLQGRALPRDSDDERAFALNMTHTIPFSHKNEFKRFDGVVEAIDNLKNPEPLSRYTAKHGPGTEETPRG